MAAQPPRPKLPPLSALRAFEAAGRLGGFAPAAQELGVTPGAVTAHLKTLESALGVALFDRHHRGVALTDLGARVLPEFTEAFRALETAVHRLEAEAAPGLLDAAWLHPVAFFLLGVAHSGVRAGRKTYLVDMAGGVKRTDYVSVSNSVIGGILLLTGVLTGALSFLPPHGVIAVLSAFGAVGAAMARSLPPVD